MRTIEKKLNLVNLPIHLRESIDVRARGASKTFDTMKGALFLASKGFQGRWFSSGRDQLAQPKKYMDYLVNNSFMKFLIKEKLKESVTFLNGGELFLTNLTELNARSSRADFLIYDEESQADEAAYRAGVSILAGSELGMSFHISTPVKATIFEENYNRLKMREITTGEEFVFSRRWDEVGFLAKKKEWYEEQKRILPGWYFRQEHEASFELPSGAVFIDVIYEPYSDALQEDIKNEPNCSGIDWNPAAGHCLSATKWLPERMAVVVVKEINLGAGYAVELNDSMFWKITPWFTNGNRLVVEDGGINIPYIKWFNDKLDTSRWRGPEQQWSREEWDNQDIAKMAACTYIIQNGITIYVDKMRFPETAKCIEEAHWDEDAKGSVPKLAKDKANSPHFLDAFLHAISDKNRFDGVMEVTSFY